MAAELRKECKNISCPREGKTVYMGSTWRTVHTEEKGDITIRMVYEIIDKTIAANGQEMLFLDTKFNLYCTSLPDPDEDIIELYHNHAIYKQFHSEIKTDMDMERMSNRTTHADCRTSDSSCQKSMIGAWAEQSLGKYFYQNMACVVRSLIFYSDFLRGFLCSFGFGLYLFYFDYRLFSWAFYNVFAS